MYRIIFPGVRDIDIPPPYIPSIDQYRQVASNPPPELVQQLSNRLLNSDPIVPPGLEPSRFVAAALRLFPDFLYLVSRDGVMPSSPTPPPGVSEPNRDVEQDGRLDGGADPFEEFVDQNSVDQNRFLCFACSQEL